MSLNLNTVIIAGHLTRDPQLKSLANDRTVAEFGLAINRRHKGADGEFKEESTFVEIEAWGRTAEVIGQYLTKGSPCYIEGRLKFESWQDKEGQKRSKLKVVAEKVQFIGANRKKDGGGEQGGGKPGEASDAPTVSSAKPSPGAGRQTRESGQAYVPASASEALLDQPPF